MRSIGPMTLVALLVATPLAAQIQYPLDLRIGATAGTTRRAISQSGSVPDRLSASLKGVEGSIGAVGGAAGIGGRVLTGTFGNQDFTLREGRLFIGGTYLRIEGAYGQRSVFGSDSTVLFIRAGAKSTIKIGGTGISVTVGGNKIFQGDFSSGTHSNKPKPDGWEGESDIMYTAPVIPIFLQLGYRTEYFKYQETSERMNGIILGGGIWLGGR